jgi:hypothetical protein
VSTDGGVSGVAVTLGTGVPSLGGGAEVSGVSGCWTVAAGPGSGVTWSSGLAGGGAGRVWGADGV